MTAFAQVRARRLLNDEWPCNSRGRRTVYDQKPTRYELGPLSAEEFEARYIIQFSRCFMCGRPARPRRRLKVDINGHLTCQNCMKLHDLHPRRRYV